LETDCTTSLHNAFENKRILKEYNRIKNYMISNELIAKVRKDIEEYGLLKKGDSVVIGLSGGADSVCLLRVLKELEEEFGLKIIAVHINHCLRGNESDSDEHFVEELCQKWGIQFKTFKINVEAFAAYNAISLEEAGRELRYKIFNQVIHETGYKYIAVAHQREDQAETIMLNILRGAGMDGLCGMNIKQGNIIRPLLNISREQITTYLKENGILWRTDSSNLENQYTRNRIRNMLFPMIHKTFGVDPVNQLVKLSEIARQEHEYMEKVAEKAFNEVSLSFSNNKLEISLPRFRNLPDAIAKRIIRMAWERINKSRKNLLQVHVNQIMSLYKKGTSGKKVVLPKDFEVRLSYDKIIFSKKETEKHEPFACRVNIDGDTVAEVTNGVLKSRVMPADEAFKCYGTPDIIGEKNNVQLFDYDKLNDGLILRNRRNGDRIRPYGAKGEKKLKDYFIDAKIPREERSKIPLVALDNKIVWVVGMRTSEEFRADRHTKKVLVLSWYNF
jgi:tRNA(Ile)-lysidine synthase